MLHKVRLLSIASIKYLAFSPFLLDNAQFGSADVRRSV
jgi:hypothetical protein